MNAEGDKKLRRASYMMRFTGSADVPKICCFGDISLAQAGLYGSKHWIV